MNLHKAAGVTRGAIYWHFKNKSDLFNEIWELSDASISDLEIEYRAKFPNDPLSVIREILVYVLEATVTEERRRLMMEIIYHKCEFVGEMTVVQQAQRQLSLASYERIEQTLKECIAAKLLPANLLTRRAAVLMRSYLSGLMENWLFAPDSFDLHAEARDYVAILLEMYQFCPTLRGPESLSAYWPFQPSPGPRRGSPRSGRGAEPAQYVKQAKRTDSAGQTGPAGSDSDAGNAG